MSCTLKELPPELRADAAKRAVEINPQNDAPQSAYRALALLVDEPGRLNVLTQKKWGPKVRLGVTFLDASDTALKNHILAHMNEWGKYGDILFRESSQGEVRITRQASGYWSYLGTDILSIGGGQPTMNLQGFTIKGTPESEFVRVVRHETGHTLGFPHEQNRQEIQALLDREKTIRYYMQTQGWSRQDVINQIFDPLAPGEFEGTAVAEQTSVMCYPFPGQCTKSGQPIPGGTDITKLDGEFVGKIYPKADAPPPVSPPPPPVDPPITGNVVLPIPAGTAVSVNLADVVANLKTMGFKVTKS